MMHKFSLGFALLSCEVYSWLCNAEVRSISARIRVAYNDRFQMSRLQKCIRSRDASFLSMTTAKAEMLRTSALQL
ncbi:MAG: hypothetical protein IPP29_12345 [Bacteroidetes bacterium]|nr:hypothetical protein [Bacteroidota bacterium]